MQICGDGKMTEKELTTEYAQLNSPETAAREVPEEYAGKTYRRAYIMSDGRREKWTSTFARTERKKKNRGFAALAKKGSADPVTRRRAALIFWGMVALALIAVLAYPLVRLCSAKLVISEIEFVGEMPYSEERILEAAGIERGDEIFSFRAGKSAEAVLEQFTYLKSCKISRRLPDKVVITVRAEHAVIYTLINGDYYALSEDLRVLERARSSFEFEKAGLCYADLPRVSRAVVGETIVLAGGSTSAFVGELLASLRDNGLETSVTGLNLSEKFDIRVTLEDKFVLVIGAPKDLDTKILTAKRIMEENDFEDGGRFIIDVSVAGLACVRLEENTPAQSLAE